MAMAKESLKKRKREGEETEELEIDLSLPEPLSKKELRKSKKQKPSKSRDSDEKKRETDGSSYEAEQTKVSKDEKDTDSKDITKERERSEWGVWIGNLPWTASKTEVKEFFCASDGILDENITRIHMPAPYQQKKDPYKPDAEPAKNKGFAYVDFDTEAAQNAAIKLSDTFLERRRVLIKQAKSFEGRPPPVSGNKAVDPGMGTSEKPPSKRIFVGNLGFDITKDDMERHFFQCGDVSDVFLATFEDTGKCKGFGWVTFTDIEAAKSAVRGYVEIDPGEGNAGEDAHMNPERRKSLQKGRRKMVNKLEGRFLRCEFAEDAQLRFKKRFGKQGSKTEGDGTPIEEVGNDFTDEPKVSNLSTAHEQRREARKAAKQRGFERTKNATQSGPSIKERGAIVAGQGKITTFD